MTEVQKKRKLQWERGLGLFLALILFYGFQSALRVQAADPGTAQQKATTGTLGENGGIIWSYDAGTKTLTVSGEGELYGSYNGMEDKAYGPFDKICAENEVERIVFQDCKLTGKVEYLFAGCSGLKSLDVSGLDTGNVTNMSNMFYGCSGLKSLDVSGLDTGNVTNMSDMFYRCSGLKSLNVSGLDTGNVKKMRGMFYGCRGLTSLDVSGLDTGNVTNMDSMFSGCGGLTSLDVSGLDTGNVTSMSGMFYCCGGLASLDISGFDTRNVKYMSDMFSCCNSLTSLDVSGFDTRNVEYMSDMFSFCSGLTSLDISGFDTGNVTWMNGMFTNCKGLTSLDVSGFETGKVTRMEGMFSGCSSLTSLDVSGFDTGNVTSMWIMFSYCSSLTSLDLSGFNTGNVRDMRGMFASCSGLTSLDVSGFNTDNVTDMRDMFSSCTPSVLKAPKTVKQEIPLDVSYRDAEGKVYTALTAENAGKELKRSDLIFYEIRFKGNGSTGGSTAKLRNCEVGKSYTLSANGFTRAGYTFTGWNTKADGSGKAYKDKATVKDLTLKDSAEVVLYAQWRSNCYSIAFSGNGSTGGSTAKLADCQVGKSYILPANGFTRTDYTFTGWNTKADGSGTACKDKATVKDLTLEDGAVVTLYAQWKKNSYSIAFSGNGSTGGSTAKLTDCQVGKSYTLPANGFTRTGYTFTGWNAKADGSGTAYKDKASVKDLTRKNGELVTLYAQWKKNRYSIAFNGNGSTGGSTAKLTDCEVGKSYILPANGFTRTGYVFNGWNTKKDGSGTAYKDKATVKDLTKNNGAVVTLYAQWKGNRYSIAFNGNGATEGTMKTLENRQVGKSYTLSANKFKRTGYTFAGWNTKKNGTGKSFQNKASVKDLTKKSGAVVTLYAQWKPNTYTVKFDGNKATSGKMEDVENCQYDKSFKLPKSAYKRKGYTFAGWNTKKSGTGKSYKNLAQVKNLTDKNKKTVVLYAQWIKKK